MLIGSVFGFLLVIIVIIIKNFVKKFNLLGFVWVILVVFVLLFLIFLVGDIIVINVGKINFMFIVILLLVFVGIFVGN